jgi:hypothetical protein
MNLDHSWMQPPSSPRNKIYYGTESRQVVNRVVGAFSQVKIDVCIFFVSFFLTLILKGFFIS